MILSSNCNTTKSCGTYVVEYLENLECVSSGLLDIINYHILHVKSGSNDITESEYACPPVCKGYKTTNCVKRCDAKPFDCEDWDTIKNLLSHQSTCSHYKDGYLNILSQTIKCLLGDLDNGNFGFAAQIERFLCLIDSLIIRVDSVYCNKDCPEIIGDLLCVIMQILTKLISAIAKVSTLAYYYDCATSGTVANRNKVISSFFECMSCDFINDLCELEKLIHDLRAIVVGFATCDMERCTPCYIATSAPRKVRSICCLEDTSKTDYSSLSASMQSPYHTQGGCSCKK